MEAGADQLGGDLGVTKHEDLFDHGQLQFGKNGAVTLDQQGFFLQADGAVLLGNIEGLHSGVEGGG